MPFIICISGIGFLTFALDADKQHTHYDDTQSTPTLDNVVQDDCMKFKQYIANKRNEKKELNKGVCVAPNIVNTVTTYVTRASKIINALWKPKSNSDQHNLSHSTNEHILHEHNAHNDSATLSDRADIDNTYKNNKELYAHLNTVNVNFTTAKRIISNTIRGVMRYT